MEKPVQITRLPKSRFYEKIFEIDERQQGLSPQIPLSRLSKFVSGRVVAGLDDPIPDCLRCGACCVYGLVIPLDRRDPEPLERYIEVTLDDAPEIVVERAFDRDEQDGRCMNLVGEIGVEIGCAAYLDRPHICREFEAGSDRCFGYRRMYGIEEPLSDEHLAAVLEKLDALPSVTRIRGIEIKVASRGIVFDRTTNDPDRMMVEILKLKMVAHMSDGEIIEIHTYDPANESWYEHELEGMTLEAALESIEQRKAVVNQK